MKIAIFWADLLHYHIARLEALFSVAEEQGHEVFAFSLAAQSTHLPLPGYQDMLGDKVTILADNYHDAGPFSSVSKYQLLNALSSSNPDVVAIIGYDGKVSRAALGWCRYHRKAAILMFVSQKKDMVRSMWKESIKKALVRCYDSALVGGSTHIEYAEELGMPHDRIFTGYNVVDNDYWSTQAAQVRENPDHWRQRFGLPEYFFLTAGRFIPKKNFENLIRYYADYVKQTGSSSWSLVVVGDGELSHSLKTLAADLELEDLIHFPGYLNAEDMSIMYGLASAFVLPSAFFEQWGLVVNEAMAASLPVIVSKICGCAPDLIIEGVTGFTFQPSDGSRLVELLGQFSDRQIDLDKMGNEAFRHVTKNYSPQIFAENLIQAAEVGINHSNSRLWNFWPSPRFWV